MGFLQMWMRRCEMPPSSMLPTSVRPRLPTTTKSTSCSCACSASTSAAGPDTMHARNTPAVPKSGTVAPAPHMVAQADAAPSPRTWTEPSHPLWRWLLAIGAVANVAALWSGPYLPFTDLPQHVAAIATIRHWSDPAWKSQEYFTLAFGRTQYLLYYLAGALLAFPFGTAERANLVLLSLTAVAFPYALRSLLRALGADQRLALFAVPLFWSQSLLIGFFNYVAALPLLLWALA